MADQFAKVELNRLNYIKSHHQKDLRAELYFGEIDAMQQDTNKDLNKVGKCFILPSSLSQVLVDI